MRVRLATKADLESVYSVWYATETTGVADPPPPRPDDPIFRHELETGTLLVAEVDGVVRGFAARVARGPVPYLAELFVHPDYQSRGIGWALLERLRPPDGPFCLFSSQDPRAQALYIRAGLRPQWPNFYLAAPSDQLDLPEVPLTVAVADIADPLFRRWDREISGCARPQDHAHWLRDAGGTALWFLRGGAPVGYGFVLVDPSNIWWPEVLAVQPVGARTELDARDSVLAAVRWARERGPAIRLLVPGPHAALPDLLRAGFCITDHDLFLTSAAAPSFDPRVYTPGFNGL